MSARVEMPLFPLSSVVLFPRVQAPLHLFEPRYRQLAQRVLDGGKQIGMVTVPPQHTDEMLGDPPVYPIGCTGLVAHSRRLPDGRFDLILSGMQRLRIVDEAPRPQDRLFRVAEVELLDDPFPPEEHERVAGLRERIIELVRQLVARSDSERSVEITPELFREVDDTSFVNSLCHSLAFSAPEKQGLLEAETIPTRFDRLEGLLSFRLAELARPGETGSSSLH